jgi:flagellar basal body-associated protein FliL
VIPISVLEKNKELQDLLFKFQDRFDFNSIDNAIPLQKKSIKYDISGHANHPKYDSNITDKIRNIFEQSSSDEIIFNRINNLINDIKNKLESDVLLGNKNVNDIIDF